MTGSPAIYPGEHLAEKLSKLDISAAELARQIGMPVNRVTGIINGQRSITADTALRLGHWFGLAASDAHSTVKCNRPVFGDEENLAWGLVAEYLSGAGVEFVLDPLDIGIGQNSEV